MFWFQEFKANVTEVVEMEDVEAGSASEWGSLVNSSDGWLHDIFGK